MKRENQKFYGSLTDKELYLIEDGLNHLKKNYEGWKYDFKSVKKTEEINNLVQKLYSKFAELPSK